MTLSISTEISEKLNQIGFTSPPPPPTYCSSLLIVQCCTLAGLKSGQCSVEIFFTDSKKGFDLLDNNVLIDELVKLGVRPAIHRWIRNFLNNRVQCQQCVEIQSSCSSWKRMNYGLPQRTKLGPLLFTILVNNSLKNCHGRIKFVDDTTAFEIIPRGSPSRLPLLIDEISNFASIRGMQLNPKKCKEMIIFFLEHNHSCFAPIFILGLSIEVVSTL